MHYKEKLNTLNYLIEAVRKLNNKLYKLVIETHYKYSDCKTGPYLKHANYCNRRIGTNR